MSSKWCPQNVHVGDVLEIKATTGNFCEQMTVKTVKIGQFSTYVFCETSAGMTWMLDLATKDYIWRTVDDRETLPCVEAAKPVAAAVEYGVNCGRCGVLCEHAEKKPGFRCYSCRSMS